MNGSALLSVRNLKKYFDAESRLFGRTRSFIHAVDDISFDIHQGSSLGLVGESGCGKTTTGRIIVGLEQPLSGQVLLGGEDVAEIERAKQKDFHKKVQMVFQDPYESLNPRLTVFDIVAEPLNIHSIGAQRERRKRVMRSLDEVGISPAETYLFRYPHELSGGQRQRVAIARALILDPVFLVADEPTSMLDVSVRAGIMELMLQLQNNHNVSYLYITHDLAVARYMCNRIAVMYLGKIVEIAETEEILSNALHPYTQALLSAVAVPDPGVRRTRPDVKGGISRPVDPPPQCRFLERCPKATEDCKTNPHPSLKEVRQGHFVACYVANEGITELSRPQKR